MMCVVTEMLFDSYCFDGVSAGIWVLHTGPKSGGELVTLFGGYCDDSVSASIWVIHTGPKSGGKLVTLFGSYCNLLLVIYLIVNSSTLYRIKNTAHRDSEFCAKITSKYFAWMRKRKRIFLIFCSTCQKVLLRGYEHMC